MAGANSFDTLVDELSIRERMDLLDRIRQKSPSSDSPLFQEPEEAERVDPEARYRQEGVFRRFVIKLQSIFSGRPVMKTYEDWLRQRLAALVELKAPSFLNLRRGYLLEPFLRELERLKEASRFFYGMLDQALGEGREAFFVFLGSLELAATHERLSTEADAFVYAEANPNADEATIRQAVTQSTEDILELIPEEGRRAMYANIVSLAALKALGAVPFDHLIGGFTKNSLERQKVCRPEAVVGYLKFLADALYSMSSPPSPPLLESLFLFSLEDQSLETAFGEQALEQSLLRATEAVETIRDFNKAIPLVEVIRFASDDMRYYPTRLGGGEDWFVVYREYWRKRTLKRLDDLVAKRRREALFKEIAEYTLMPVLPSFNNVRLEAGPTDIPVRKRHGLCFLLAFSQSVFPRDMLKPLKLLMLSGEFFRKENRIEFTDAYDELLKLSGYLAAVDAKLGVDGEYGRAYAQIMADMASPSAKRQRFGYIRQQIDSETDSIILRSMRAFKLLTDVLGGVLKYQSGGKYDTISNFASIEGRGNELFMSNLSSAQSKAEKAYQILGQLCDLDRNQ
jgi:hypothetical protein